MYRDTWTYRKTEWIKKYSFALIKAAMAYYKVKILHYK